MSFFDSTINLLIPFIAWIVLAKAVDKVILEMEGLMNKVKFLPNKFSWTVAYLFALCISFIIAWQGRWSFFTYLDFDFRQEWQGYLMSAFVVASGSQFIKTTFSLVELIPYGISGISTGVRKMISNNSVKENYEDENIYNSHFEDSERYTDEI